MHSFYRGVFLSVLCILFAAAPVQAGESTDTSAPKTQSGENLGKIGAKLANPLGELYALSMSFNMPQFYDGDANTGDPELGATLLFQPILPIPLYGTGDDEMRLMTRPIIPFIFSQPIPKGFNDFDDESGVGDIQLPLLFSVPDRIAGNFILGAGPVWFFPTATDDDLGQDQWALGPAVVLGYKNNFVSGIIMLFERPVRVGDYIELGGVWAEIRKIGLRATVVRTFDAADIVVPNSDLISNQVTNWTLSDQLVRRIIPVGVAYGSDVPLVTETLMKCATASSNVLKMPAPQVLFRDFGESSLDFELRVWIANVDNMLVVESDLRHDIDRRFRDKGIEIAFPQRDLHIRSVDESPGSILKPSEDRRPDLVVVPRKEKDEEDEKDQ
ncbi:MAG: mechanosensitive ion channel [Deltaproteobacteria bacterium]|nr:mechanosensitive ion channel [Deltaproteobacteria bacterium]